MTTGNATCTILKLHVAVSDILITKLGTPPGVSTPLVFRRLLHFQLHAKGA